MEGRGGPRAMRRPPPASPAPRDRLACALRTSRVRSHTKSSWLEEASALISSSFIPRMRCIQSPSTSGALTRASPCSRRPARCASRVFIAAE
jgi:hypothetical protein